MKEKLQELRNTIKAKLDEADKLLTEGKFEEVKAAHAEIAKLQDQAKVLKAQIDARADEDKTTAEIKSAELEQENKDLKGKLSDPARLPFDAPDLTTNTSSSTNTIVQLRYGEVDSAVKAVLGDIYGSQFNYNERRNDQMKAFVKFVRFGENRLNAKEFELLVPSAKNIILQPDTLKAEVESGRTVGEIKATLEEGSNDLGGVLVPEDYRTEIIKRLMGVTVVRGKARVVTTIRDSVEWPRLEGGNNSYTSAVRVTWVDETPASASAAETNPTFGLLRIPIHTVMARTNLSKNLLEDSAFNLLDIMAGLFGEAMAIDEDNQFLVGQGAGTPYGVLGDLTNGAQPSPVQGVTGVVTGNATQVTAFGFVDLVYSLPAQYRQNAIHVMARTTLRDVRKLQDGESRFIWQAGLVAGQPQTVLGYGVSESELMPAIGANAYVDIFGDWGNGYVIADRVGMSVERVADTTTVGTNQVALFARRRLGGQVVAPWAFAALQCSA